MASVRDRFTRLRPIIEARGFELRSETIRADTKAGIVLGVESVPDGLASGLLAGVNPVAGLYAYLYGVATATFFTSATFMAVQGTGAMAIVVADVDIESFPDPTRALVTLSVLTGLIMIIAGYFKAGSVLRFIPNAVMTGFISAVGINIVLGQVDDLTGYASPSSNRLGRTFDTVLHFWRVDPATLTVGLVTVVLILVLRRTRLGAMGLVVAIVVGSVLTAVLVGFGHDVARVGNIAEVPNGLPIPALPRFRDAVSLLLPAISLAFVGLVQGAAVSATFPGADGQQPDPSQDFVGQGVGNVVAGIFRGMPVGGSMSASSLTVAAGARSRLVFPVTGAVMAVVILLFGGAVEHIAMPSLAGLLMVVGVETIKPRDLVTVYKTGLVQATVMPVTLVLTLVIPLQFAVLVGVGISVILYVIRQSNQITTKRLIIRDGGLIEEVDPPAMVPSRDVVVLQPYGSLFFAAAPMFEEQLPAVTDSSVGSVVILRFRGKPELGSTVIEVLERYAVALEAVGSKLSIVTNTARVLEQLEATGTADVIGRDNLYRGDAWLSRTVSRANEEAWTWVKRAEGSEPDE